jgi:hypothetical protein
MKIVVTESVKRIAGMALSVLLVLCVYRADLGVFLRIVVTAALVYGAGGLMAKLIEKVWSVALTFADNRKVRSPRMAAVAVVLFVLFVAAAILMFLSGGPGGRVVVLTVEGGFLVVGGFLVAGRVLSSVWDVCAELVHKSPVEGGTA